MKNNSIIGFQYLYMHIRDRLTPDERDSYKYFIDSLSWTRYERDMVEDYCGVYEVSLVDSTEFAYRFRFNSETKCFETRYEIIHPQVKTRTSEDGVKMYQITDTIVKYIR